MSLYDLISSNPTRFVAGAFLPEDFPHERFRDVFMTANPDEIILLTRTGGDNRSEYRDVIANARSHPNHIKNGDWEEDNTYAVFLVSVPKEWREDAAKVTALKPTTVSQACKDRITARWKSVLEEQKESADSVLKRMEADWAKKADRKDIFYNWDDMCQYEVDEDPEAEEDHYLGGGDETDDREPVVEKDGWNSAGIVDMDD